MIHTNEMLNFLAENFAGYENAIIFRHDHRGEWTCAVGWDYGRQPVIQAHAETWGMALMVAYRLAEERLYSRA